MALDIYREVSAGTYAVYGRDGVEDGLLPIVTTHDGVLGEVAEVKLFVRADTSAEYYRNIAVIPVSKTTPSDVTGTDTGHGAKLYRRGTVATAAQQQPTEAEWEAIDYAASIDIPDIGASGAGDANTYLAFWYRIECPAGAAADNKENVVLRLSYTAYVA